MNFRAPYFGDLGGSGRKASVRADALAGLTTAIMLVPQAMAYAMLAGLPPQVGLYAAVVPPAIYAFLGTSRQLAVGPVAMDSLLVAVTLAPFAQSGSATYIALAVVLALIVGLMQIAMGFLKLGFLTQLLSAPVISGFTSAAALVIGLNQLQHLLGLDLPRSPNIFEILGSAWTQLGATNMPALIIGTLSVVAILSLKKKAPRVPGALVVVVATAIAVIGLGLHDTVSIVGIVPAGLPSPSLPDLQLSMWGDFMGPAFAIALVGFMESISVSKALAARQGYEVDSNQELVALGAANLGGAFFGGYPITGGFSRSAVNAQAGARSNLAGLMTAGWVLIALTWLTPAFYYLPKTALAAIIMTAVFGLIDLRTPLRLGRTNRVDLGLLVLTFAATLYAGIQQGIAIGAMASLLVSALRKSGRVKPAAAPA